MMFPTMGPAVVMARHHSSYVPFGRQTFKMDMLPNALAGLSGPPLATHVTNPDGTVTHTIYDPLHRTKVVSVYTTNADGTNAVSNYKAPQHPRSGVFKAVASVLKPVAKVLGPVGIVGAGAIVGTKLVAPAVKGIVGAIRKPTQTTMPAPSVPVATSPPPVYGPPAPPGTITIPGTNIPVTYGPPAPAPAGGDVPSPAGSDVTNPAEAAAPGGGMNWLLPVGIGVAALAVVMGISHAHASTK